MNEGATMRRGEPELKFIHDTINTAHLGSPTTYKNLTMIPLLFRPTPVAGTVWDEQYVILDEALAAETARVTEVSDAGSVAELKFLNEGNRPVLLLDGEELVGAKQNRVLNLSILAPSQMEITIPVSCVELGRWAHRSRRFRSEKRIHYSRGRSRRNQSVSMCMEMHGSRHSDQSEVWNNIKKKSAKHRVSSPTEAMSDIYEQHERSMNEFFKAFSSVDGQVGAIFGIDGAVAGTDLFDASGTFSKLMPKLIQSYALDALETCEQEVRETSKTEALQFLDTLSTIETQTFPAVGLGHDVRLKSEMVSGGALVNDGHVVHLAAFPLA